MNEWTRYEKRMLVSVSVCSCLLVLVQLPVHDSMLELLHVVYVKSYLNPSYLVICFA